MPVRSDSSTIDRRFFARVSARQMRIIWSGPLPAQTRTFLKDLGQDEDDQHRKPGGDGAQAVDGFKAQMKHAFGHGAKEVAEDFDPGQAEAYPAQPPGVVGVENVAFGRVENT